MSRVRIVLALAAAATIGTLGSTAAATPAPTPTPLINTPSNEAAPALKATDSQVRLLSGDVVRLRGKQWGTIPAPGSTGFLRASLSGHQYVIPRSLSRLLGRQLDPSLFDVSTIAAKNHGAATPVSIVYAASTSPTEVPGIEITSRSGLAGTGVITAQSSAALARRLSTTSAETLFAGVRSIAAAAPGVSPNFPMFTVKIQCLDAQGLRTDCVAIWMNLDDAIRGSGIAGTYEQEARASLPAGNYWFTAWIDRPGGVAVPQHVVLPVTGATTVVLDARTATTKVVVSTPDSAGDAELDLTLVRTDSLGSTSSAGVFVAGAGIWTTSTQGVDPVLGTVGWAVSLLGPDDLAKPTRFYSLAWWGSGFIPASLRFVPRRSDLETSTMVYLGNTARSGKQGMIALGPFGENGGSTFGFGVDLPLRLTAYSGGAPGVQLAGEFQSSMDWETGLGSEYLRSAAREIVPGTTRTEEWNRGPFHPTTAPDGVFPWAICSACLSSSGLSVVLPSHGDNNPLHWGLVDDPDLVHWSIALGTTPVASGNGPFVIDTPLPRASGPLVLSSTETRPRADGSSSTTATTWRTPRTNLGEELTGWSCADGVGPCRALSILTATYALPISNTNTMAAGTRWGRITLTSYRGTRAVTSFNLDVRYGTGPWMPVPSRSVGVNTFSVGIPVPAGGGQATLRLRATDSGGSSFSQTLTNAFTVAP